MTNKTLTAPCGLTLARATVPLRKTWRAGAAAPLLIPRVFDFEQAEVEDLTALGRLLTRLEDNPFVAVLRGAIADPARAKGVRRLTAPDPVAGEPATLVEAPRRWVALDLDNVPLPAGTDPRDLETCARHAITLLPAAFRAVRCIAQGTASHGIKPGARLRLWFWLSRPTSGAELQRWLAGFPVDPSCCRPAQLVFTARPEFVGSPDPIPCRLALLPGADAVECRRPARSDRHHYRHARRAPASRTMARGRWFGRRAASPPLPPPPPPPPPPPARGTTRHFASADGSSPSHAKGACERRPSRRPSRPG